MLTTEKQKKICEKYSARDSNWKVHCNECPLRLPQVWSLGACRATYHYDRHRKEWVLDEDQ